MPECKNPMRVVNIYNSTKFMDLMNRGISKNSRNQNWY